MDTVKLAAGDRVCRGPDWPLEFNGQGGADPKGTVLRHEFDYWYLVAWDNGDSGAYWYGEGVHYIAKLREARVSPPPAGIGHNGGPSLEDEFDDQSILAEASSYPDDNPKTLIGTTKPTISSIPPVALYHMGQAMADGRQKYGLMNWRDKRVSSSIYYDAALRHLMSWWDGENRAEDSGVHHLAHAMACLGIILVAESSGQLNDDRPTAGMLPEFIVANTKKTA